METVNLASEYRQDYGKGANRRLREQGRVPAVIYGHSDETVTISIEERELRRILVSNWETTIIDLDIKGSKAKECNAIIKDVQQDPGSGRVLHIDFQYIHRGEKIGLNVPVRAHGEARGVKEQGGILEYGPRELAIRCMPRHIPEDVQIEVTELEIQDAIRIKDIADNYPDVEFLDDHETALAIVVPPRVEAAPEEAEEEEVEGAEPEVIAKGKEEKAEETEG